MVRVTLLSSNLLIPILGRVAQRRRQDAHLSLLSGNSPSNPKSIEVCLLACRRARLLLTDIAGSHCSPHSADRSVNQQLPGSRGLPALVIPTSWARQEAPSRDIHAHLLPRPWRPPPFRPSHLLPLRPRYLHLQDSPVHHARRARLARCARPPSEEAGLPRVRASLQARTARVGGGGLDGLGHSRFGEQDQGH